MRTLILLLLILPYAGCAEIIIESQVKITTSQEMVSLFSERDNRLIQLRMENIFLVISPEGKSDNNGYTDIVFANGKDIIRLLQRNNPASEVIASFSAHHAYFTKVPSDQRELRSRECLVNAKYISLIDRTKVDAENSDTTIYFGGHLPQYEKIVINQTAQQYKEFMDLIKRR